MSKPVLTDLDFGGVSRILGLSAPGGPNEPARLADLNSAVEGLNWKDDVRVSPTANVNLAAPGANIDGVAMALNDRVAPRGQTALAENGIYIWNGAAVPMTRSLDANTAVELKQAIIQVNEGASAGTGWRQTSVNFVLGTDPVVWAPFGVVAPPATETTAGIAEIATQAETDAGTDDARFLTPLKFKSSSLRIRKVAATIGDGAATSYAVTHNFGTFDVQVTVYRSGGNRDDVLADVQRPNNNTVNIIFASAPALNAFNVVVTG